MAFTPTTLLSLPLIDTGTESGTWGELVDNGLTSYLDIAIAGGLAISITGSGTTVTLANTAGTSSVTNIGSLTAQYAILNISGAKTGNCTLVLPSSSRRYTINNAGTSTGVGNPWTLTVKGAATTGITLIDGERVDIAWNGTDYVKVGVNSQPSTPTSFPNMGATTGIVLQSAGASSAPVTTSTGGALVNFTGYLANPQLSVTDSGGSSVNTMSGALFQPAILSSGVTNPLTVSGTSVNLVRGNASDISEAAINSITGSLNTVTLTSALPATALTNTFIGYRAAMNGQGSIINDAMGFYATMNLFTTNTTNSSTVSSVYGYRFSSIVGAASGTGFTVTNRYGVSITDTTSATATVTNYYGLYLTHTVTGTVTNRYGVYSGDSSATNYFAGSVLASGATGGLGYGTGSGGTVTQVTSRTTGVTLSKNNGAITMFSAAGSTTAATFTVTNTRVAATDTIILNQKSGTNLYVFLVTAVAAGSFNVTFYTTGGTATDAPVINFALIKAVTA